MAETLLIERNNLVLLEENEFLKHCVCDFYKARGPGGQKKNKTESAVRLTLKNLPIAATAAEDRKQSINRSKAVKRLKLQIAFECRLPAEKWQGQLDMNPANKLYPHFCAVLFDHFHENDWQMSTVANKYAISTNKLVKIIGKNDTLWQEVNRQRLKLNHKALRK